MNNDDWRHETQPLIYEGGIHMPYSWTIGKTGSSFFMELRDHQRIMGNQCPECHVIWVPPRLRCPECYVEISQDSWKEIGPNGTLRHFTIVHYSHPAHPLTPPFAYGIIDLDGASRGFTHLISGVDLKALRSGLRLKPIWRSERQGSILDIDYFTPIGG
ncbi:MAG: hypothetical protein H6Q43_1589 [Deltaproteobacteria bacterium]|jgi:hypothetical protein|nr:hypothetical protein [Deltaproteobacteria bacterium]MBP1718151.1 hypothetical protein [Deltaproteobacteria bacterium]